MKHDYEVQKELDTAAMELSVLAAIGGFVLGLFIGSVLISGLLS